MALVDNRFALCWVTLMAGLRNRGSMSTAVNVTLNDRKNFRTRRTRNLNIPQ